MALVFFLLTALLLTVYFVRKIIARFKKWKRTNPIPTISATIGGSNQRSQQAATNDIPMENRIEEQPNEAEGEVAPDGVEDEGIANPDDVHNKIINVAPAKEAIEEPKDEDDEDQVPDDPEGPNDQAQAEVPNEDSRSKPERSNDVTNNVFPNVKQNIRINNMSHNPEIMTTSMFLFMIALIVTYAILKFIYTTNWFFHGPVILSEIFNNLPVICLNIVYPLAFYVQNPALRKFVMDEFWN